jgi:osmotically inducible protein OsmC
MATERTAEVSWNGSLTDGSGRIESTTSGVLSSEALTWRARSEDGPAGTSPEDLIAAAHAGCFAMQLSHLLTQAGTPPDELKTSATVSFQPGQGITRIRLTVRGRVPGLDDAAFQQSAEEAKEKCPVSRALAGVPEITLESHFDG